MRYNNYHKHDMYGNIKSLDAVVKPIEYVERAKELDTLKREVGGIKDDMVEIKGMLTKMINKKSKEE